MAAARGRVWALKAALGVPSLVVPAIAYVASFSPVRGPDAPVVMGLALPAAVYLAAVRSFRGSLYFGACILALSVLPWIALATDRTYTDLGPGILVFGSAATALLLALSAAAVDRSFRSAEDRAQGTGLPASAGASPPYDAEAVASFVLGMLGLIFLPVVLSVPAVVLGRRSIRRSRTESRAARGTEFARAGEVLGWIGIGFGLLLAPVLVFALI